jgi:hypothetical protein
VAVLPNSDDTRRPPVGLSQAEQYWTVKATLQTQDGRTFTAQLTQLDGEK